MHCKPITAGWRRMHVVISARVLRSTGVFMAGLAVGVAVWAADPSREAISFGPYTNLYALQQTTDLNVGFKPGSAYVGYGGSGQAVDVTLTVGDFTVACDDASYEVDALEGILTGGRLFCPAVDTEAAIAATRADMALLDATWTVDDDFLGAPRRVAGWGRDVADAFAFLERSDAMRQAVTRVPLRRWTNDAGAFVTLNAVRYAKHGDDRLQREVAFAYARDCLDDFSIYRLASPEEAAGWALPRIAAVRAHFSDRSFTSIPLTERVRLTSDWAEEVCERG